LVKGHNSSCTASNTNYSSKVIVAKSQSCNIILFILNFKGIVYDLIAHCITSNMVKWVEMWKDRGG